ncbi:MAG TPA: hypothetical protein VJL58_01360 [Pyrinomonadaceae bacterium]|nr:hypothetical protein [Pyrinomonadaceae bacterium]
MNSVKCPSCHLVNLETDFSCRRCATQLHPSTSRFDAPKPRKKGVSIFSIILIGAVIAFVAWAYTNIQKEIGEIDAQRIATQPAPSNTQGFTSRSEEQRQRTGAYGNAVQNSPALAEHEKRVRETEKMVQNTSVK